MIIVNNGYFPVLTFGFSGGERQLSVDGLPDNYHVKVVARLENSNDIMDLLLLDEVLNRKKCTYDLTIPYLPYGRQDRVMQEDEAFSLKVMAKLLNGLNYNKITTFDCHSSVTNALIDRLAEITQSNVIMNRVGFMMSILKKCVIIAPDAGAVKKAYKIASFYKQPFAIAEKIRGTSTGEIIHTKIDAVGENAFIIDDICDGGRTFIELAKALRDRGFTKIYLYVTHGIFSQGLDVFDGLIDHIYTTNTFRDQPEHPLLTTIKVI